MSKRALLKKINIELWVTEKVGIPTKRKLSHPEVQNVRVPVYFTIGELRTMQRALKPKRKPHPPHGTA